MKKLLFFSLSILVLTSGLFSQASNTCAGAALIATSSTCVAGQNQFSHTLTGATADNPTITGTTCSINNNTPDVWYRFRAQTEFPVITVNGLGSSWTTLLRVQILSGGCSTFTDLGCGSNSGSSGSGVTVSPSAALTPGTIYYVRVSKSGTGAPTGANWTYNICIKEGAASRMGEVFKQTILAAPNVLNYPWEVAYGLDNNLWVTEARGYRVYRINPTTGARTTVLDLSSGSTWLTAGGAPAGSDTLAAINTASWNGGWPSGTSTNPNWPQGGLAGMALHPNFLDGSGTNDYAYITYVHRYLSGGGTTGGVLFRNKLVRFTYNTATNRFGSPVVLCDTLPGSNDHNSQRLIIAPVGGTNYLFFASGDMGAGQFGNRDRPNRSQNINSYEGKILRFNLVSDGDAGANAWIPNTNPYGATNAVWAIGIRNNQGFAYNDIDGVLYGTSHGPYSDDELNVIEGFRNYGHPHVIGYYWDGNYNGTTTPSTNTSVTAGAPFTDNNGNSSCPPIGDEAVQRTNLNAQSATKGAYQDPIFCAYAPDNGDVATAGTIKNIWATNSGNANWPSEAWSGLDFYSNNKIPGWRRTIVAAGLKWGRLIRMKVDAAGTALTPFATGTGVNEDTITYFQSANRYRDLAFAPNGRDIFLVMDNSSATSGPGVGNPTVPGCQGCLIKYSFLGYADDGSAIGKSTIPTTIDVTTGAANSCTTGNSITIDATNNNLWVPITGPDGNILAEINAAGNNLGVVTASFYRKTGGVRAAGSVRYLDRNITITPAVQPSTPVKIRLYIAKAEFDALDADPLGAVSAIGDLRILKNNDACVSAVASATTLFTPTVAAAHGVNGYVLQANIPSFSSFYFASSNITTLPVNLISFTGALQNDGSALLKWRTENEVNTSYFSVERSNDGSNFYAIGRVNAAGNGTSATDYNHTDADASLQTPPVVYYRLKIMDRDGQFTYSNIVTVSLSNIVGRVSVYPNPTHSAVTTEVVSGTGGNASWQIVDNSGRVVLNSSVALLKGRNTFVIDLGKLSAGVYYLKIIGGDVDKRIKIQKL